MAMRSLAPWRWGRGSLPSTEGSPLDAFQREMNRLFDDFFKGFGLPGAAQGDSALRTAQQEQRTSFTHSHLVPVPESS